MDIVIINDKLIVLDYGKDKEYLVEKNIGTFIKIFFDKESPLYNTVKLRLGEEKTIHRKVIGHEFSLL